MAWVDNWGPSRLFLQILCTIAYLLAMATSLFRLVHRIRISKFWWDDFWLLVSLPLVIILWVFLWIQPYLAQYGSIYQRIILAWVVPLVFNVAVWMTRLSIASSIVRILPPGKARIFSLGLVYSFLIMCCGVVSGKVWICARTNSWHRAGACPQEPALSITQLITDILSSTSLVVFPLYVLWNAHLPVIERRLILSVFAASTLITSLCVLHAAYSFSSDVVLYALVAHLEAGVSVTVCNALVVVTRFYRFFRHEDPVSTVGTPVMADYATTPVFTQISTQMHSDSVLSMSRAFDTFDTMSPANHSFATSTKTTSIARTL